MYKVLSITKEKAVMAQKTREKRHLPRKNINKIKEDTDRC